MTRHMYFYTHLVPMDTIVFELYKLDMSDQERVELLDGIQSHLHLTVVDIVLSRLAEKDKKLFIEHMQKNTHVTTMYFVKERINDIEHHILHAADELKHELIRDMRLMKKREKEEKLRKN